MGNVFHFIGTIKWGLNYDVLFILTQKTTIMKNFIKLLVLSLLFASTSCTIDNNDHVGVVEQKNSISENSYKTATITYNSTT